MKKFRIYLCILTVGLVSCSGGEKSQNIDADSIVVEDISIIKKAKWQKDYFVDEFGEPTKDAYAVIETSGDFSNSATSESQLNVRILVTSSEVRFNLYEYGSQMVKGEGLIKFKAKLSNDSIIEFDTYNSDNGANNVSSTFGEDKEVIRMLKANETIRFSARTYDSPVSTYRFSLDADTTSLINILKQIPE